MKACPRGGCWEPLPTKLAWLQDKCKHVCLQLQCNASAPQCTPGPRASCRSRHPIRIGQPILRTWCTSLKGDLKPNLSMQPLSTRAAAPPLATLSIVFSSKLPSRDTTVPYLLVSVGGEDRGWSVEGWCQEDAGAGCSCCIWPSVAFLPRARLRQVVGSPWITGHSHIGATETLHAHASPHRAGCRSRVASRLRTSQQHVRRIALELARGWHLQPAMLAGDGLVFVDGNLRVLGLADHIAAW